MGRDSINIRGLPNPLPHSPSGLYRVDYAVTTVNLERMTFTLQLIRRQHELHLMRDPYFAHAIPTFVPQPLGPHSGAHPKGLRTGDVGGACSQTPPLQLG